MIDPNEQPRAPRLPEPQFASVTPEQIERLVDDFYGEIREDPRLGPIFDGVIGDHWDRHLGRMKGFWRAVLLKTGEYTGRPVPAHMALPDLREDDFRIWIGLFETVSVRVMDGHAAPHVNEAARRIARSLWLARFGTPFSRPPAWLS